MYFHFRFKVAVVQEGAKMLTRCVLCIMHMSAGWLIKHHRTAQFAKNTQMRWQRRDVAIADK